MTSVEAWHEHFDRLCALAAANQTTPEEERSLAEHADSCLTCRQAVEQYRQIVTQTYGEADTFVSRPKTVRSAGKGDAELMDAKEKLLAKLPEIAQSPVPENLPARMRDRNNIKIEERTVRPALQRTGWAVAAVLLLGLGVSMSRYWLAEQHSKFTEARMAVLQKDIGDLHQQLATRTVSPSEVLPNIRPSEKNELEKLKAENNTLRQSLSMADAARQRQADDYAELWSRTRLLQSSMDVLQASKASLEAEKEALSEKIGSLTADVKRSKAEVAQFTARNDQLSQEALSRVRYVERQQRLLATDHDIRELLGSRSLRIIDVYDVTSEGEFERPFGRVFYTDGKSLIFYAFDLDQQKGLKRGAVFQAWGQKGEEKESPHSLGTFYMDDPVQNRWVLKVDDGKALSRIDYIFVTDGSRKEGIKPKGKPLLSAFLNGTPNRP